MARQPRRRSITVERGELTPEQIEAAAESGISADAPQYRPDITLDELRRHQWVKNAGTAAEFELAELDPPPAVLEWVEQWRTERPRKGLFLSGNTGAGKTTLMKAVLDEVIHTAKRSELNWTRESSPFAPVIYTSMSLFIADTGRLMSLESRKRFDDEYDEIDDRLAAATMVTTRTERHAVLLGLDDIGTEYSSGNDWVPTRLNDLLRLRGQQGGVTIATSNKAMALLGDTYGPAAGSYCYEAFTEVIIVGKDRRR